MALVACPLAKQTRRARVRRVSTIAEIESAVSKLSPEELAAFRRWFQQFDAAVWDRQFEKDVDAGRLDALGQEALRELRDGRCPEL